MNKALHFQLPKCPEDRFALWYGLGLLAFFIGYLVMIFYTCWSYLNHPHTVSPSQVGSAVLAWKMHKRVVRFAKTKIIGKR